MPEILEERFGRAKSGLMLAPANAQAFVGFFCTIDPKKYKGIGLLKKGHEINVDGEIESVKEGYFYVKEENLFC